MIYTLLINVIYAQDFQLELHKPHELPKLPDSLTLDEFHLLNRDLGWKELFTAIIFSGYATKYAKEDSAANYVIAGRYLGLTAMSVVTLKAVFDPDIDAQSFQDLTEESSSSAALFIAGLSANIGLSIFDWG